MPPMVRPRQQQPNSTRAAPEARAYGTTAILGRSRVHRFVSIHIVACSPLHFARVGANMGLSPFFFSGAGVRRSHPHA